MPVGDEQPEQQEEPKMSHKMLDSLEGYLDNIASTATQTAATGTPLAELATGLAVSVDTVARQQIEIKRPTEHINALRKKGGAVTAIIPNTGVKQLPKLQALCSGRTLSSSPQQQVLL